MLNRFDFIYYKKNLRIQLFCLRFFLCFKDKELINFFFQLFNNDAHENFYDENYGYDVELWLHWILGFGYHIHDMDNLSFDNMFLDHDYDILGMGSFDFGKVL